MAERLSLVEDDAAACEPTDRKRTGRGTRSAAARALLVLVLALLLPAAGCGSDDRDASTGPLQGDGMSTEEAPGATATSEDGPAGEPGEEGQGSSAHHRPYQFWLVDGDALTVRWEGLEPTPAIAAAVIRRLLRGSPDSDVGTAIPADTRLLGIDIRDGLATVDLSAEFESGGGSRSMFLRLGQVVYTMTQFPTVTSVRFRLDGEPLEVFSAEGIVLDKPVTREDYADLLAPIVVESPAAGAEVRSPVTVSGSANVFEANVTLVLLDAQGKELVRTFTTATCGSGCRGNFAARLRFRVPSAQTGTLLVHDDDAAGTGTPPHEVRIPLRLSP